MKSPENKSLELREPTQTNRNILPMDIKDKTQLNMKRKDKRELAEEAVIPRGTSTSEVETEQKPEEGHDELYHDILGHYV